jgi:putative intracellular protease/amidase
MKMKLLQPLLALLFASHALDSTAADSNIRRTRLPVLMVIADQRDFHYQEYNDTRRSLEASGLTVKVAATTTARSIPHPNTGQSTGTDGSVVPDLRLTDVIAKEYSAVVFVGGWGSSMYQYAYNDPNLDGVTDNFYAHAPYNGDDDLLDGKAGEAKVIVNQMIGQFLATSKPVAGICHGVTVLAWARVDGTSPLQGKKVVSGLATSPSTFFLGRTYADGELTLHEQIVANGGFTNPHTGQFGDPTTASDDVIVDGRIITAENYESAALLGRVIAAQILGSKG